MNELLRLGIAPSRRLVSESICRITDIAEYFNPVLDVRIIEIPSQYIETHKLLETNGISVPRSIETTGETMKLQIPSGSQTIQQVLKSIATDTKRYSPLFEGIGIQLDRAQSAGFGFRSMTEDRTLLGSIIFSPIERGPVRDSIFFVPPYPLLKGETIENTSHNISSELMNSGHFSKSNARELMFALMLGVGKNTDAAV